jgi:hypothetical protein
MMDKKATYDDVCVGVVKLLGEDALRLLTRLINNIYETAEWSMDFSEVTTDLKIKPRGTKRSDHRTYSKDSGQDIQKE